MKSKLEYIWLDGYAPTQSLRSKTMVHENFSGKLEDCKMWCFDGSSTEQADGNDSDCLLRPVMVIPDPDRKNSYLVPTWFPSCRLPRAARPLLLLSWREERLLS